MQAPPFSGEWLEPAGGQVAEARMGNLGGVFPGFSSWKLRHRLLLLIFCVVTGTLVCSLALVELQVREHVRKRVSQDLQRSMTSFQQRDQERGQALSLMVAALESGPRLAGTLQTQDYATIVDFLRELAESYQVVLLTDSQGKLLLRTDQDGAGRLVAGLDLSRLRPIQAAIQGKRSHSYCGFDGGLWSMASVPLSQERDGMQGTLTIGYRAEQNLAQLVSREFDSDVTIFAEGKVIATNEGCLLPADLLAKALAAEIGQVPDPKTQDAWWEFDTVFANTQYRGALAALGSAPRPVAYIALLQNNKEAVLLVTQTRWSLGGLGVLALAAALLVSIPVVGRVANPVELIETVVQTVGDGLIHVNEDWTVNRVNLATEKLLKCPAHELLNKNFFQELSFGGPSQASLQSTQLQSLLSQGQTVRHEDGWVLHRSSGTTFACAFVMAPVLQEGQPAGAVILFRDITELKAMQMQLLSLSHQAGMAEVATGTLHNVGNALNSVSVSASLVADKLRNSKLPSLSKSMMLLDKDPASLAAYLTEDPKGRKLPLLLSKLVQHMEEYQAATIQELEAMLGNLDHVKKVIKMQQAHTKTSTLCELVNLSELLDGALAMSQASHPSPEGLKVLKDYSLKSSVSVEKHKLLQILVNLCSNGLEALSSSPAEEKILRLCTQTVGKQIHLEVHDNGMGIAPEHLEKLFTHGFTTKPEGHGFGLHNSALAALSMGGRLVARSPGLGLGATFVLELPASELAQGGC